MNADATTIFQLLNNNYKIAAVITKKFNSFF